MRCLSKCHVALRASALFLILLIGATLGSAQDVVRTADITARGLNASEFPRIKKLADNVYSFEQLHPNWKTVTSNSLIVVTSDGVLVAEGQGNPDHTTRLVEAIRKLTPQPIKYVVIGSEHGDHTGGNSAFPDTVTFIGHPTSKANLERQAASPNRPPTAPKVVIPTELVSERRTLKMGNTQIDILHPGRAHTGGDLIVSLPREKVLFMSEVFFNRLFPSMNSAYPSEWVEVLKKAEQMDVSLYVPAHGFVDSPVILKEELINYRRALEAVIAEGRRLHTAKVSAEEAPKQANFGPYASWTRSAENAPGALRRVYLELDGQLK